VLHEENPGLQRQVGVIAFHFSLEVGLYETVVVPPVSRAVCSPAWPAVPVPEQQLWQEAE
jgi:hypothetical protein